MPDRVLNVVWGDGEQHVQQDALLAGVAAVAVDVDQVAAQASVHLGQTHSLQPTLMEGDVILLHHGFDCLPAPHAIQVNSDLQSIPMGEVLILLHHGFDCFPAPHAVQVNSDLQWPIPMGEVLILQHHGFDCLPT